MLGTGDWEASGCRTLGPAQEMYEIQSGTWVKLGGDGAFVTFGDLGTQERFPPLEPANATSRDLSQRLGQLQMECLGRGLYGW